MTQQNAWIYLLEVENQFRNSYAKIEYYFYSTKAEIFEAGGAKGKAPSYERSDFCITVKFKGAVIGRFTKKSDAIGCIKNKILSAPPECRKDCLAHVFYFYEAIFGEVTKQDLLWTEEECL